MQYLEVSSDAGLNEAETQTGSLEQHSDKQFNSSCRRSKAFAASLIGLLGLVVVLGIVLSAKPASPEVTQSLNKKVELESWWTRFVYSPMHPNPAVLKWLDPSQVKPGGTACGFMLVPLGSRPDLMDYYPDVEVYVCILFAKKQPAKGTMFGHAGGPGSLSYAGMSWPSIFEDYNAVGFDQRGLGRSLPTFATPACSNTPFGHFADEAALREALEKQRKRQAECFHDPYYLLPAKKPLTVNANGDLLGRRLDITDALDEDAVFNQTHFNFLQYSGTRQLAEDMERFRIAIGERKLSVFGVSYGTMVAATYATMFPNSVGKFVLNSPVPPMPNMYKFAWDEARGAQQRVDNLVLACQYHPSVEGCDEFLQMHEQGIVGESAASAKASSQPSVSQQDPKTWAHPTGPMLCPNVEVAGQPSYCDLLGPYGAQSVVMSQSTSGNALDPEYFVARWKEAVATFPSKTAVLTFSYWWGITYAWPRQTPVASMRSSVKGVVIGFMYDPNTPYAWAQEFHDSFPNAHLITSQVSQHGLQPPQVHDATTFSNSLCFKLVREYIHTDKLPNDVVMCNVPLSPTSASGR